MSEFSSFDPAFNPFSLEPAEVSHILIPGRGRRNNGAELTPVGEARVATAADLYGSGR